MAIMSTAMEPAGILGRIGQVCPFFHGQGVHVCTQTDRATFPQFPSKDADNASLADATMHLYPPVIEHLCNDAGRSHLLEADFRILVQIAADCSEIVAIAGDTVDQGHGK